MKGVKGALIVGAVSGDGGLMREISRDLRMFLQADVPRHFLIGVGLPHSTEAWTRLKQFLERNQTTREYGFSAWAVLPIGDDGNGHAWDSIADLAGNAQLGADVVEGIDPEIAEKAIKRMSADIRKAHNGFLPTIAGAAMDITDGFVFFGKRFDNQLDKVTDSFSYLTVASVLQAARDLKDPENQLRPTGYESVVLSPECFLRFNDNLLQACMLRACHPSELDYSTSPHLSKLMKEFLAKVFARADQPYGGSALEFAAALATGRMKLAKEDLSELVTQAIAEHCAKSTTLLGLLLVARQLAPKTS